MCPVSVEGFAERKIEVGLVAARTFDGWDFAQLKRLVRQEFGVAFRRGEDIGLVIGHEVRRVGRRDVGEGLHWNWDESMGPRLRLVWKYRPHSRETAVSGRKPREPPASGAIEKPGPVRGPESTSRFVGLPALTWRQSHRIWRRNRKHWRKWPSL